MAYDKFNNLLKFVSVPISDDTVPYISEKPTSIDSSFVAKSGSHVTNH